MLARAEFKRPRSRPLVAQSTTALPKEWTRGSSGEGKARATPSMPELHSHGSEAPAPRRQYQCLPTVGLSPQKPPAIILATSVKPNRQAAKQETIGEHKGGKIQPPGPKRTEKSRLTKGTSGRKMAHVNPDRQAKAHVALRGESGHIASARTIVPACVAKPP